MRCYNNFLISKTKKHMKSLIILVLTIICTATYAQNAEITKKDGQKTEVSIIATSSVAVSIPNGTIPLSDISSVNILEAGQMADRLALYFSKAGIPATIKGQSNEAIKLAILATQPEEATIKELSSSIEKFRVQRQTGKAMQMLGVIAVGASILIKDNVDLQKGLAIGGCALSTIGFVIDLDAGKHLKIKR